MSDDTRLVKRVSPICAGYRECRYDHLTEEADCLMGLLTKTRAERDLLRAALERFAADVQLRNLPDYVRELLDA